MGPVIEAVLNGATLDTLFRLPTGCGEQTASKLGPLVYVAKYLKETGQITGEWEKQLYDNITTGIRNEMTFRRSDGGFSMSSTSQKSNLW